MAALNAGGRSSGPAATASLRVRCPPVGGVMSRVICLDLGVTTVHPDDALVLRDDVDLITSSTMAMTTGDRRGPVSVDLRMTLAMAPTR